MVVDNYLLKQTSTEKAAEGALLYINKKLSYHLRNNLNIYIPGKLESILLKLHAKCYQKL